MRSTAKSVVLVFLVSTGTGAGLCLLAPLTLRAAAGEGPNPPADVNFKLAYSTTARRSAHVRILDASKEPPPPANAHPGKSRILGDQKIAQKHWQKKSTAVKSWVVSASRPVLVANHTYQATGQPAPILRAYAAPGVNEVRNITPMLNASLAVNAQPHDASNAPDPEALRIREELKQLHDNHEARQAFYEDLRQTVEGVRTGKSNRGLEKRSNDFRHSTMPTPYQAPCAPSVQERASRRGESPSESAPETRAALKASGASIDRAAYLRVVRWAKANGTPIELALGVAWTESRLHSNPPRGKAGEVGMYQIMPARCTTEGWPSRRLSDPEFNAWMGTLLLGRYYQQEGSVARAAAMYVAGPGVFNKKYSKDVWAYINWYASSVDSYASYFSRYQG